MWQDMLNKKNIFFARWPKNVKIIQIIQTNKRTYHIQGWVVFIASIPIPHISNSYIRVHNYVNFMAFFSQRCARSVKHILHNYSTQFGLTYENYDLHGWVRYAILIVTIHYCYQIPTNWPIRTKEIQFKIWLFKWKSYIIMLHTVVRNLVGHMIRRTTNSWTVLEMQTTYKGKLLPKDEFQ